MGGTKWSPEDAQRFRDRDVLKARSVPSQRLPGPSEGEWELWTDDELDQFAMVTWSDWDDWEEDDGLT